MPTGGGLLSAHCSWPPRWQQPGKPESSGSQTAIYQESYFPQRGCDDDMRPTRLTADVENMSVSGQKIASRQHRDSISACCSSSISSVMIGSWRVGTATRHQFRNRNRNRNRNRTKIRNRCGVCIHSPPPVDEPFATAGGLSSPSLSSAHAHAPRRPTAFRFSLTTTNPDCTAPNHPAPFQASLVRPLDWPPRALVCFPRIHTDPCHLTDGKKEGEGEKKKRSDSAPRPRVDHWTSSILTSPAWTTRKTSHTSLSPPMDLVRPNHGHRGRLGMQGTDPPFTESVRPSVFPSFQVSTPPRPPRPGLGPRPRPRPLVPFFVMSWSRKPQPPACLCL